VKKIRILVVDDNVRFTQAAQRFLATDERMEVLPSAHSGETALPRIDSERPELVLTDLSMPGMSGTDLTREIKRRSFAPKVIVISLADSAEYLDEILVAGADAFLHKAKIPAELIPLIERLFQWDADTTRDEDNRQ
jgi:two-component system response regulator DegU